MAFKAYNYIAMLVNTVKTIFLALQDAVAVMFVSHSLTLSFALTLFMWLWWVMIPIEDEEDEEDEEYEEDDEEVVACNVSHVAMFYY